jgi:hypothetical protein
MTTNYKKIFSKQNQLTLLLQIIALIIIISMFCKAIIDVDKSWDTWFYHIPFAARLWGIIPEEAHFFYEKLEVRYDGFPLLASFFQGMFWYLSKHIQAANLFDFFSLILICVYLKSYFQVPLYASAIAFLAIPLVQIHATSCYVDLPGAVCFSILTLTTFLLYIKSDKEADNWRNILTILLSAAAAANIKLQLVPLVVFVLFFALIRIVWLRWQAIRAGNAGYSRLLVLIPLIFCSSILIFATPLKNVAFYGNPFYPIRMEIFGHVLNHKVDFYSYAGDAIKDMPQALKWLRSIFEINSAEWEIAQWSADPNKSRLGGFFGAYVVFNLLLLGYLVLQKRSRETIGAVATLIIMSVVTANAPQSHELRYYLYWMIILVSLNLFLVTRLERFSQIPKAIKVQHLTLVCLIFFAIVVTKTNFQYIKPNFYTLDKHLQTFVAPAALRLIQPGETVCLVNKSWEYRKTYMYSSYFHPELNYDYSIKSVIRNPQECGDLRVIKIY